MPGGNLIQVKVWTGCCAWGFRARLEDAATCTPLVDGEGKIEVGTEPIDLFESPAQRSIVTTQDAGTATAVVTIALANGGQAYNLDKTFDADWQVGNMNPMGESSAGKITWTGITANEVTYTVSRNGDFFRAEATGWKTDAEGF